MNGVNSRVLNNVPKPQGEAKVLLITRLVYHSKGDRKEPLTAQSEASDSINDICE